MAFDYNEDRKESGTDIDLFVPDGSDPLPVTSVSWSEEADTSEVQFNDSYSQDIAVTGVSYSGSFEIAGRNGDLEDALYGADADNETTNTRMPRYISAITFQDGNGQSYTFDNVLITSHDRDAPADDRVTQSYDFTAEKLIGPEA